MSDAPISPFAFIGSGVEIGLNVKIGPGAVILGPCVIEDDVWIGSGAQIGAPPEMTNQPQNTSWTGELTHAGVRICRGAVIREGAIIHQGSYRATTVGAGSWILNRAYLAHDVLVGVNATISAGVSIGGHCEIGDRVNIGMNAAIHQRVRLGAGSMVGMNTPVNRDVPPYTKTYGSPARIRGVNGVGLSRQGVPDEDIAALSVAYSDGDLLLLKLEASTLNPMLATDIEHWKSFAELRPMSTEF